MTIDLKNPSSKISLSPQTSLDSNNYRNSYNINCLNTSNFTNSPTFKPGRKSEFYMRKNNCSQDFFFSQEKTKMTDKKPYRVEPPDITTFYDSIVNDKKKNATKMERSFDLIKKFEPPIRNGRVNLVYQFQTQIDNHRKKRLECNTDPKNVEDFDSDDLSEGLYELVTFLFFFNLIECH